MQTGIAVGDIHDNLAFKNTNIVSCWENRRRKSIKSSTFPATKTKKFVVYEWELANRDWLLEYEMKESRVNDNC